jgi:O-antigen/teichoic acid export membrane protein
MRRRGGSAAAAGADPDANTRRYGRDAGSLGVALGAYGVLTYLYFAIASHSLDASDYGDLVVLWAAVFIIVATLYRPVEQLLTRSIAHSEAEGRTGGHEVRNGILIQALAAVGFLVAALAARTPIQDELLSGSSGLYYVFLAAVIGYAGSFFARGLFAGSRRFGVYSALILAEAVARISVAVVVAVGLASGTTTIALGIALGPIVSLLVIAPLLGARVGRARSEGGEIPGLSMAEGSGFAIAVLFIMGAEQILLNGGPLFVRLDEGTAAAGFLFNVLMLVRAPLLVFQAVATSLLPHLTRLRSLGGERNEASFDQSIRVTLLAIAAFTAAVALIVAVVGPQLMQVAFGDNFDYPRVELLAMCPVIGLYLASWTLNQAALAEGRVRTAAGCWVAAALLFVVINLVPSADSVTRAELAFGLSSLLLASLLALVHRGARTHPEDVPSRGTAEELEARVAVADEIGS